MTSIIELPVPETLQQAGITRIEQHGGERVLYYYRNKTITFKIFPESIKETIEAFEASVKDVRLDATTIDLIKDYISSEILVRAELENDEPTDDDNNDNQPRKSKAQQALELAKDNIVELFQDQHGTPYATVKVNNHVETSNIGSSRFKSWLFRLYYQKTKEEKQLSLLSSEDTNNVLNHLKADAEFSDIRKELELRISTNGEKDTIYYDLTNSEWQAVKITSKGWEIVQAPVAFVRYNNQIPQVYPRRDYQSDIFDKFFELTNVKTKEDKQLLKCYLIASFIPGISKAILILHGEQGSAKSTLQELIKMLIDPCSVKTLSFPRDINQFIQVMSHNYVVCWEKVSHISDWQSDELCKAVTGSGFSKRRLYTDDDDVNYNFKRCIGFNGINLAATKADLLDRSLIIQLERIPKEQRRKVEEIWLDFEKIRPYLLEYIFDIIAKVLASRNTFKLKEYPRMADFAEIAEIISRCMGNPENAFLDAYYKNIGLQTEEAIEANPIALCISNLMEDKTEWKGTATLLLEELENIASNTLKINTKHAQGWPKASNVLSRKLNEVKTNLREIGISIDGIVEDTHSKVKLIRIVRKVSPQSPQPSQEKNQAQIDSSICGDIKGDTDSKEIESPQVSPHANQARCDDCGDCADIVHISSSTTTTANHKVENGIKYIKDLAYFKQLFKEMAKESSNNTGLVERKEFKERLVASGKFHAGEAQYAIETMLKIGWIKQPEFGKLRLAEDE